MSKDIVYDHNQTLSQALEQIIRAYPDRTALAHGEIRRTYQQLGDRITRLATSFVRSGIATGEKIAIIAPSSLAFVEAFFATSKAGGVAVPINPTLRPHEMKHILQDSEAVAVVVADRIWGATPLKSITEIRSGLPGLRHVLVAGSTRSPDTIPLEEWVDHSEEPGKFPEVSPKDLAALIYTSGTTGKPKGSMHSHRTLLFPIMRSRKASQEMLSKPGEVIKLLVKLTFRYGWRYLKRFGKPVNVLSPVPMYTTTGLVSLLGTVFAGNTLTIMERFIPSQALKVMEQEEVNAFVGVPTMVNLLLRDRNFDRYNLQSMLYVVMGGAPVPPSLVDAIEQRIGCIASIGFGATELGGGVSSTSSIADPRDKARETVGKLQDGWEARIVDENRQPLPPGEVGELAIRGGSLMEGYYKAEELTQQTIDEEGWYYTGDLASIDEDGYIKIVGRKKDLIIRGGQNIYPAELEAVLLTHPQVVQAAVVGVPDEIAGEKVLAFVVVEDPDKTTPLDILDYCREQMAPYKVPNNVHILDELPMNQAGKVQKFVLQDLALGKGKQDGR